jgi:hypothetical protein
MRSRFALQAGWRCVLAFALAVMPWASSAHACPASSTVTNVHAAADHIASGMAMPCGDGSPGSQHMAKHAGGSPDPCGQKGACNLAACAAHCVALTVMLPAMPSAPMLSTQHNPARPSVFVLDDPPQESLRPPIA